MPIANVTGIGYPHDGRADNAAYRHDRRADNAAYRHDRRADSLSRRFALRASPITRMRLVDPDQRVITGLKCSML